MAELDLVIHCNSLPAKLALKSWLIVLPVFAGVNICALAGQLLVEMPLHPLDTLPMVIFHAAALLFALWFTLVLSDTRLIISRAGLSFPRFFLPWLGFKRERAWAELAGLQVITNENSIAASADRHRYANQSIRMHFRSGRLFDFRLADIPESDVTKFLLSLDVWGAEHLIDSGGMDEIKRLTRFASGDKDLSTTNLWELELSRRFGQTAYVPLEPGARLRNNSLRVVRQLALGGLSAIYLAQEREREMVVVKESVVPLYADEQATAKARELFDREAQLLLKVDHPNVCKVLDCFVEDERHYLLLEYIAGTDLRQLVHESGKQPEKQVIDWAAQIAAVIAYLHGFSVPIIHRDISPDNIVLKKSGRVCLIDFGAANEFLGTATGTMVGKQSYISPEQFRGKASPASDIYSLGCTMYFLLTGDDPVPISVSDPRTVNDTVSIELSSLVQRCTQLEVADRLSSADELHRDLLELAKKETLQTR